MCRGHWRLPPVCVCPVRGAAARGCAEATESNPGRMRPILAQQMHSQPIAMTAEPAGVVAHLPAAAAPTKMRGCRPSLEFLCIGQPRPAASCPDGLGASYMPSASQRASISAASAAS